MEAKQGRNTILALYYCINDEERVKKEQFSLFFYLNISPFFFLIWKMLNFQEWKCDGKNMNIMNEISVSHLDEKMKKSIYCLHNWKFSVCQCMSWGW